MFCFQGVQNANAGQKWVDERLGKDFKLHQNEESTKI